jgi:hypothetical protein
MAIGFLAHQPSKIFGKTGVLLLKKCRPDWDITRRELKAAWGRGECEIAFFPMARPTGRCWGSKSSAIDTYRCNEYRWEV